MSTFRNNDRVRYIGEQKHLKDLVGTVKRNTVAPNGNILVQFDDRPVNKPTVVNPKNLELFSPKVAAPATNPKDKAVIDFGRARDNRSAAEGIYKGAKKELCNLGLISDAALQPGTEVVYESNAVQLVAATSEATTYITPESLAKALDKVIAYSWQRDEITKLATLTKKTATTYKVVVK